MAILDELKTFEKIYPLFIQKYETFIPSEENSGVTEKINSMIQYLSQIGRLNNDVVNNWNKVMKWLLEEGLSDTIETMVIAGQFDVLFNTLVLEKVEVLETALNNQLIIVNDKLVEMGEATDATNEISLFAKEQADYLLSKQELIEYFTSEQTNIQTQLNNLVLESGTSDAETIQARGTFAVLNDRLDNTSQQLADTTKHAIHGASYGINNTDADNYMKIITALDVLKAKGGGTLLLPYGIIRTAPISFQGYNGITIKGINNGYPVTEGTTIKIVGTNPVGSVGLKFSDDKYPREGYKDTWNSEGCVLEGIFLDCDNKCDMGINGNRELTLNNVTVRRARVDGIVFEDWTYPITLNNVESGYNGRHGIRIRGGYTTVYQLNEVETMGNGGYGLVVEGGAGVSFKDVAAQANKQGGLKIDKVAGYPRTHWLDGLTFINFYSEANGTLLESDPLYEGNCAVYITGYDKTNSSLGKPQKINFIGGMINTSVNGKAIKIDAVRGCKFDMLINGSLDVATVGVYGLEFATSPSSASVPNIGTGFGITSYHRVSEPKGIVYNGGLFPNRGRTLILEFYLPIISAGTTTNMNSLYQMMSSMTLSKGYSVIKEGSILGFRLIKKGRSGANDKGTVTGKVVYYNFDKHLSTDPSNAITGISDLILDLNTPNNVVSTFINAGLANFNADTVLGIRLTTSSDYTSGTSLDGYLAQLMIEI